MRYFCADSLLSGRGLTSGGVGLVQGGELEGWRAMSPLNLLGSVRLHSTTLATFQSQ